LKLADEEDASVRSVLADARLQRLLTIGQEINALRSKIRVATKYIGSKGATGGAEDVVLAREALRRDLERDLEEAKELMPIVDELVSKFEEQVKSLEDMRKVHEGLAKIEGLSGATTGCSELEAAASKDRERISELESLVGALDDLGKDLSLRREVVSCPRCSSHEISYRITPSEMGFSLYRCNKCGNAWRIRQFSLRIGSPAQ
jgi:DNA-directed RNA polymerase subunit M/transcription elongation factor TFIIS